MRKVFAIHPVLFSIWPVLLLFVDNIVDIPTDQMIFPVSAVTLLVVGLWLCLSYIIKDVKVAAIILSPWMVAFLVYGRVYEYAKHCMRGTKWHLIIIGCLSILGLTILLLYSYKVIKLRCRGKIVNSITNKMNLLAIVLIGINLIQIGIYLFSKESRNNLTPEFNFNSSPPKGASSHPDIYYILLDEYASLDQLRAKFNYDGSEFTRRLERRGFYIATKSRSRYIDTHRSLSAVLNMENPKQTENASDSMTIVFASWLNMEQLEDAYFKRLIRQNRVMRILKSLGYKYIHFGSWYYATRYNIFAEENFNYEGFRLRNELNMLVVQSSIIRMVFSNGNLQRGGILYAFDQIASVAKIKGPKFLFAHIICPHNPFVFGANGEKVPFKDRDNINNRSIYLGQYIFVTKKVERLIDEILCNSNNPPIIIIQSDHGYRLDKEFANQIFNAYYLPGIGKELLSECSSPVNTFRIIFNKYFDGRYELIGNSCY
jgi:hypothetical protein